MNFLTSERKKLKYLSETLSWIIVLISLCFIIILFAFTPQLLVSKNGKVAYAAADLYSMADNKKQTILWLKRAIDEGSAKAACELGHLYDEGDGVEKNTTIAMNFYKMAADRSDYYAMYILGMKYLGENGNKISPNDLKQALSWFIKSMDANANSYAADALGYLYANGLGVDKNTSKAIDYFYKSGYQIDFRLHTVPKTALIKKYAEYRFSKAINSKNENIFKGLSEEEIKNILDISAQADKKLY